VEVFLIELEHRLEGLRGDFEGLAVEVALAQPERGLGAALVPKQLSLSWLESKSLVQLFDHELVTTDTYYLVYRPDDRDDSDIQLFRDWALRNFADDS